MINVPASILGFLVSFAMFLFSVSMYLKTWDWVPAVFALGSLGYSVFFLISYQRNRS